MKKIVIEKEEGIAEIIDRMTEVQDPEITMVFPKGSVVGRSVRNFHLLKREADAAGKSLLIESVDENILAFAKESGFEGNHPLWRGVRGSGGISDIVPRNPEDQDGIEEEPEEEKPASKKRGKKKAGSVKLAVPEESDDEEDGVEIDITTETEEEEAGMEKAEEEFFEKKRSSGKKPAPASYVDEDESMDGKSGSGKYIWWGIGVLVVIFIVLGVITWSFGHVTVSINFKKDPWSYQGVFAADKSVSVIDPSTDVVPAQVFTTQKNLTQLFPASGNANVSLKAQGTLTIFNAYSSASQDLVATTRFVTPDGKIFRLVNNVTVPGAQVTNGQIVPSSIDVPVVADQAGTAYNLGPVAKLMIPGFQNSPKYNAFYGEIKGTTSGGFVGTKAVPTAADITSAKASTTALLQTALANQITTSYPNNFKILDGASSVSITKLTVSTTTDQNGNFSVFGEATLQAIGFDETAFKAFLLSLAQTQEASSTFSSITLSYASVMPDFTKGRVSFSVSGQGTLEPAFSADDFKASIEGKSIGDARMAIAGLPELANGTISAWPMWLWSIPSNPAKIEVDAD